VTREYPTDPTGTVSGSLKIKSDFETESIVDHNLNTVKEEEEEVVPVPEEHESSDEEI